MVVENILITTNLQITFEKFSPRINMVLEENFTLFTSVRRGIKVENNDESKQLINGSDLG